MTKKPPSATSAYAIGLRWALFFLLSFYVLGYPPELSIVLSIAGGMATGMIFKWWHTKDEPAVQPTAPTSSKQADRDRQNAKSLSRADRWKRRGQKPQGGPSLKSLQWPFRKR